MPLTIANLADRIPRSLQITRDLHDRLAIDEVLTPNPGKTPYDQGPPSVYDQGPPSVQDRQAQPVGNFGRRSPVQGVNTRLPSKEDFGLSLRHSQRGKGRATSRG